MNDVEFLKKYMETRWGIRWTDEHARDVSQLLKKAPEVERSEPRRTLEPLVNGETYFFRYPIYLHILQELAKSRVQENFQARFRVLCAGCSTGEEAYSISFALLEMCRKMKCKLEVLGFDLRTKAIETAKAGIYLKWSLRNMGEKERLKYLVATGSDTWEVTEPYRSSVDFRVHNLMEPLQEKPFDAVLLCNVLMYMHDTAVSRAYQGLEGCVLEDSILITGPADPPPANGWFLQRELHGWPVYSRTPSPVPAVVPEKTQPALAPAEGHGTQKPSEKRDHKPAATHHKAPTGSLSKEPGIKTTTGPGDEETLWEAWAQGKLQLASERIRQKVFFEPEHPLWRFLNGVILREHGWLRKSLHEIEKANSLLDSYGPDQTISGLCTARELKRMIDFWRQQNG